MKIGGQTPYAHVLGYAAVDYLAVQPHAVRRHLGAADLAQRSRTIVQSTQMSLTETPARPHPATPRETVAPDHARSTFYKRHPVNRTVMRIHRTREHLPVHRRFRAAKQIGEFQVVARSERYAERLEHHVEYVHALLP